MGEFESKQARLQEVLHRCNLDALVIRGSGNFAWATCGARSFVNVATNAGAATLLVTRTGRHLITSNLEAARLIDEEHLLAQGWEFHVAPWYANDDTLTRLTSGLRVGSDLGTANASDLSVQFRDLRVALTVEEGERFRTLGQMCTAAIEGAARAAQPGTSEQAVSALLAAEAERRGVQAITNIVAADERIALYRHALPTDKTFGRYLMLVLCGRKWGLVCSITRFVHVGPLSGELRSRSIATAGVAAAMLAATTPGTSLGEIFDVARIAYRAAGVPDEWEVHHQGGVVGYEPREIFARPGEPHKLQSGQACVWNPSIANTRNVDSFLVTPAGPEMLTASESWPSLEVTTGGTSFLRPAILEI
jgi:Xaa-Pro aminopeptidase